MAFVVKLEVLKCGIPHTVLIVVGPIRHRSNLVLGEREPTKMPSISGKSSPVVKVGALPQKAG